MGKQTKRTKQAEHTLSPAQAKMEKKLNSRERKLRERLQEAREAQAEALERFERAQARLEKRMLRTQNLEARLTHVQHQLHIMHTSPAPSEQIVASSPASSDEVTSVAEPEQTPGQMTEPEQPALAPSSQDVREEIERLAGALHVEIEVSELIEIEQDGSNEIGEAEEVDEAGEDVATNEDIDIAANNVVLPGEASGLAKIARAVAETAERAARVAIERAVDVASRLEQMSSGRHLIQELMQTQTDADHASAIAQQAQRAAEEAERLAAETEMLAPETFDAETPAVENETQTSIPSDMETSVIASEVEMQEEAVEEQIVLTLEEMALEEAVLEELIREEMAEEMILEEQEASVNAEEMGQEAPPDTESLPVIHLSSPESVEEIEDLEDIQEIEDTESVEEIESIEEIEEEEDMLQAITAKLVADAAAAAAAEAEALAEASSSRTREARRFATDADRALDDVRSSIRNGSMSEDEARIQLHYAEHEATRAHALLADAEAAEEEALNAARNAEAEAEVAEGMAFASNDIAENALETPVTPVLTDANVPAANGNHFVNKGMPDISDTDTTTKIRKIYPRQPM